MLIEKPRCNFKNCRYCFDGNCYSADKYENCKVTDLHSEIAKLTVDLDNAKAEVAREIFAEIETCLYQPFDDIPDDPHYQICQQDYEAIKKTYTEGKE